MGDGGNIESVLHTPYTGARLGQSDIVFQDRLPLDLYRMASGRNSRTRRSIIPRGIQRSFQDVDDIPDRRKGVPILAERNLDALARFYELGESGPTIKPNLDVIRNQRLRSVASAFFEHWGRDSRGKGKDSGTVVWTVGGARWPSDTITIGGNGERFTIPIWVFKEVLDIQMRIPRPVNEIGQAVEENIIGIGDLLNMTSVNGRLPGFTTLLVLTGTNGAAKT